MSIRRANDWFRVSGFTLAFDESSLCFGKIDERREKLTSAKRARKVEVIFCPRQLFSDEKCPPAMFLSS